VPATHEDLDLIADQREHALAPELLIVEILLHARVELVPHLRHDLLDLLRVVRLLDLEGLMEDVGHGRLHEVQVQVQDVRARVVVRQHRLLIDALTEVLLRVRLLVLGRLVLGHRRSLRPLLQDGRFRETAANVALDAPVFRLRHIQGLVLGHVPTAVPYGKSHSVVVRQRVLSQVVHIVVRILAVALGTKAIMIHVASPHQVANA